MSDRVRVLFICLGNICRSPVAEGVLRTRLRAMGLDHLVEVSSAGLGGWHAGERPDGRSLEVAKRNGVVLDSRARVINPDEFEHTHWIICMDQQNRRGLEKLGAPSDRVRLLKSFAPRSPGDSEEVDDPYEHGTDAFDRMFTDIATSMEHFIEHLIVSHTLCRSERGVDLESKPERARDRRREPDGGT